MAGFNVSDFRSVVATKDYFRPNKFLVRFTLPNGLVGTPYAQRDQSLNTVRWLSFWAEHVTLPQMGVNTMEVMRYGYGTLERRPVRPDFYTSQITFSWDELGDNWQLF